MSGGVDSSVAAALLVQQGYEVSGLMLRLWSESGPVQGGRDNRCCTRDQMLDAHLVARRLGIPFEVIDAREQFRSVIVEPFIDAYTNGATPNPCLSCNRQVRFGFLLNQALKRGADALATGHYARITRDAAGRYELRKGADPGKDQSYVLSVLTQAQLGHAMFPVGGYPKQEVRRLAAEFGLPVASKHDSQDLCFIADGDYRRFLREQRPEAMTAGPIALSSGEIVGEHEGLPAYTIGQRKGLGVSWSEPLYVLRKEPAANRLIVGTRDELGCSELHAISINWIAAPPDSAIRATVKIRYKARPVPALITPDGSSRADVSFDAPLPDITPGQGAVFYDDDRVLGGGIIAHAA
jgi:tRNA-specific 2-thiouridylase